MTPKLFSKRPSRFQIQLRRLPVQHSLSPPDNKCRTIVSLVLSDDRANITVVPDEGRFTMYFEADDPETIERTLQALADVLVN